MINVIDNDKNNIIYCDDGFHIRAKDDMHIPSYVDEYENVIEEHIPQYFTRAYVPKKINESNVNDFYISEPINASSLMEVAADE